jgi:hypothetical protein
MPVVASTENFQFLYSQLFLLQSCTNYADVKEGRPKAMGDDETRCFLPNAGAFLYSCPERINQPKATAATQVNT